ncbi:MAG: hypothetical protein C0618_08540 [Desulfuromonas sp.]|nr:MAG: hypothetical protein C0618_08540 [Desulfuromonas sp.]
MSQFHFLRPDWFWCLPPLLILLWLLWRKRLISRNWQGVCDPELLPHLLLGKSTRRAHWPLWLTLIALLTAVIALAGPTWKKRPLPLFSQDSALVICLDLSRSMLAADLTPSRLVRAKLKIRDILSSRTEGLTALIAFAGDAFVITPLTEDTGTIEALLAPLEPDLMPVQGSNPGRALPLATELLQQTGLREATVLLITDEDRPQRAIASARQMQTQGLSLQVLGIGTTDGAPIPQPGGGFYKDSAGQVVLPRLQEQGLSTLAAAGGGRYHRISIDDNDFRSLLSGLESRRLDRAKAIKNRLGDQWQEMGIWLLPPLALLTACAFRRGWLLILLLLLVTPPRQVCAISWQELWQRSDQRAAEAFAAEQYQSAAQLFNDPRWKASALYRAGHYDQALAAQPEPRTADDWYNRGNALAHNGQLQTALDAYDRALELNPDAEDTRYNRRLVEEAIKQQQEQSQQGDSSSNDSQGDKNNGDNGDNAQDSQNSQNPQGTEDSAQQPQNSAQGQQTSASNSNPQEQRTESQPSEQQEGKQPPENTRNQPDHSGEDAPGEDAQSSTEGDQTLDASAEDREIQQWLQSIPDDPGGLLRRKFLYQYRQRGEQRETDRPW